MHVQQFSPTPQLPKAMNTEGPQPPRPPQQPEEKWDSVTFDSATNTYHFERPGHHYSASLQNPLKEGLVAATLIGVPTAFGAGGNALLGGLGATAVTAFAGPALGATIGGVMLGRAAYKETNQNPIYTGLAALAGAGVGAVAFPLLALPGTWGGVTGAVVATAGVGAGAAIWTAVNNHKLNQKALDAGYKPQQ